MDSLKRVLGISSTSNGSASNGQPGGGKRGSGGGWHSPNVGGDPGYNNG